MTEIRYAVVVRSPDGSLIDSDVAIGNTPSTALCAARALRRQLQHCYPGYDVRFSRVAG